GAVLATVNVPNTGGWQTYQTVSAQVNLTAGLQTLRLQSVAVTSWNINWWELNQSGTSGARASSLAVAEVAQPVNAPSGLSFYPNPVRDQLRLTINNKLKGKAVVE